MKTVFLAIFIAWVLHGQTVPMDPIPMSPPTSSGQKPVYWMKAPEPASRPVILLAQAQQQPVSTMPAPVSTTAPPSVAPPVVNSLPAYIMAGLSYNQFAGAAGFVTGIIPESNSIGLYGSATTDLVPVKITLNGKNGYTLSGSARAGEHKIIYNSGNNMLLLGGDIGASFSPSSPAGSVSLGLAGSFTVTFIRQLSTHWAVGLPVRMLYLSGVWGGSGAWNPVIEPGIIWKP